MGARRALNIQKRRFPARAVTACKAGCWLGVDGDRRRCSKGLDADSRVINEQHNACSGGNCCNRCSELCEQACVEFFEDGDTFPLDPTEWADTDGDQVGNAADPDDDGDGFDDLVDALPLDPTEWVDTDGDETGDGEDPDDDNDGQDDEADALPLDPTESLDTDSDGFGNTVDRDDDGDDTDDVEDSFPLDPSETEDTDSNGVGNQIDPDDDGDAVADDTDMLPLDPTETKDADLDGEGNNAASEEKRKPRARRRANAGEGAPRRREAMREGGEDESTRAAPGEEVWGGA